MKDNLFMTYSSTTHEEALVDNESFACRTFLFSLILIGHKLLFRGLGSCKRSLYFKVRVSS